MYSVSVAYRVGSRLKVVGERFYGSKLCREAAWIILDSLVSDYNVVVDEGSFQAIQNAAAEMMTTGTQTFLLSERGLLQLRRVARIFQGCVSLGALASYIVDEQLELYAQTPSAYPEIDERMRRRKKARQVQRRGEQIPGIAEPLEGNKHRQVPVYAPVLRLFKETLAAYTPEGLRFDVDEEATAAFTALGNINPQDLRGFSTWGAFEDYCQTLPQEAREKRFAKVLAPLGFSMALAQMYRLHKHHDAIVAEYASFVLWNESHAMLVNQHIVERLDLGSLVRGVVQLGPECQDELDLIRREPWPYSS